LEKLLRAGSFGGSIGHLAHRQATLLGSLGGLGFPFVVRIVAFAFLGCWALIALALVIRF